MMGISVSLDQGLCRGGLETAKPFGALGASWYGPVKH